VTRHDNFWQLVMGENASPGSIVCPARRLSALTVMATPSWEGTSTWTGFWAGVAINPYLQPLALASPRI